MSKVIVCLMCQNDIQLEDDMQFHIGDILECPHCGSEMEIVNVNEDGTAVCELVEDEK